jgi:hypothetical protein
VALAERQSELVEGSPEPLEKEGTAFGVVAQQERTALPGRETQDRDLVLDVVARPRDEQLHD